MTEKPILSFFSPSLVLDFELGKYESLRWRRKYYEPGEFEIHTSEAYFGKVYRGQLVLRKDRKEAGIVKDITVENGNLAISGRFLSIKLGGAAIRDLYNFNGPIEAAIRQLVEEQYSRVQRTLPLVLAEAHNFPETFTAQISLKNLLIALTAMARAGNMGFIVYPDPAGHRLLFEVYKGTDHTVGQSANTRVIFSDRYKNISEPKYQENDNTFANYAIVCGTGEGEARKIVDVDQTGGADRVELLVDARDLSRGENQTEEDYTAALRQRGADKLAENALVQSFGVSIKSTSQFIYKEHWDLGDVVTAEKTAWGLQIDQRITEIEEVFENNAFSVTPTLGTPLPETFDLGDNIQ